MDSAESVCILDAVKTYGLTRPRPRSATYTLATGAYEVKITTAVSGWSPDTHVIRRVWFPINQQGQYQQRPMEWDLYLSGDGYWYLKFLVWPPTGAFTVEYGQSHVLDLTPTDSILSEAPGDFDACCHLAASNVLRIAANSYAPQYNTTLGADSSNTSEQSKNYALRAKDEAAKFREHMDLRPTAPSERVTWGYNRGGNRDRFWNPRRNQ